MICRIVPGQRHLACSWGLVLAIGLLMVSTRALHAADSHFCDCRTGAQADCVAGSDQTGDGSALRPWQSLSLAQKRFRSMGPGDTIRLCEGGSFRADNLSSDWDNPRCQADLRCRIEAYSVSETPSENAPSPIVRRKTGTMFNFEERRGPPTRGVDIFRVDFICDDCTGPNQGIRVARGAGDMTFDQITLDGFAVNFYVRHTGAAQSNVTLKNSRILNGQRQGVLGGSPNMQILDNYFENNGGLKHIYDHSIYLSGDRKETGPEIPYNIVIRGNEIYKTSHVGGSCTASAIVGHSYLNGIIVEENFIHEDPGTANRSCYGIDFTPAHTEVEKIENIIVRRNLISNMGGVGVWLGATRNSLIENNVFIDNSLEPSRMGVYLKDFDEKGGYKNEDVTIRNNSAYFADSPRARFVQLDKGARGAVIANNAIYIGQAQDRGYCFRLDAASVSQMDNNLCLITGSAADHWVSSAGTLAEWTAKTGFDRNSIMGVRPEFKNPADLDLAPASSASPLVGAGSPGLASSNAMPACDARHGAWIGSCAPPPVRGTDPDIGAYQLNPAGAVSRPPAAPVLLPLHTQEAKAN